MIKKILFTGMIACSFLQAENFEEMLQKLKQYSQTIKKKKQTVDTLQQQLKNLEKQKQNQQLKIKVVKLKYEYIQKYKDFFRTIKKYYELQLLNFDKYKYIPILNKVTISEKDSYEVNPKDLELAYIKLKNQYKNRVELDRKIADINKILKNKDLILVNKENYDRLIQTYEQIKQNQIMSILQQNPNMHNSYRMNLVSQSFNNNIPSRQIKTIFIEVGDTYKSLKIVKKEGNFLVVKMDRR